MQTVRSRVAYLSRRMLCLPSLVCGDAMRHTKHFCATGNSQDIDNLQAAGHCCHCCCHVMRRPHCCSSVWRQLSHSTQGASAPVKFMIPPPTMIPPPQNLSCCWICCLAFKKPSHLTPGVPAPGDALVPPQSDHLGCCCPPHHPRSGHLGCCCPPHHP